MITDNNNGTHSIVVSGECFNIVDSDSHTSAMLNDFKTDPAKLAQFEALIEEHGAAYAYYAYNGLPIPISIIEQY